MYREPQDFWSEEMKLQHEKEQAELASLELFYNDVVRELIRDAETVNAISRIMFDARKGKYNYGSNKGKYFFHHSQSELRYLICECCIPT